jgi:16S rRNA (cytosine967-C5)-methyltransferase
MPDNQARRRPPAPVDAPGVPARRAALRLLDAVLRRGEPLDLALPAATRALPVPSDRALAHAIAAETLRRLTDLDALIDTATRLRLPDDAKARFALRIALVQALALGTPPHAAIATVLPLVDGGPRKLVHGVFGTLMRQGAALPELPALPATVAERWRAAWGETVAEAAARAIAAPPPLDLSLAGADVTAPKGERLAPNHVRLHGGGSVPDLPGFAEGAWWVQDLAASIPARLIGRDAGTALDLCAAPGGKTLQLAAAGWQVTAVDSSEPRLARLRENLTRTRLDAQVIHADVRDWAPAAPAQTVLLDAPCSATGIFRRHPDVLYRARPAIVSEMAELQRALLSRAAEWVAPGGTLVYATCSLEPEEGEAQIEAFLSARPDFALRPAQAGELPQGITPDPRGWVRTLPGTLAEQGGCDGFFVARLMRASA